MRQGRSVQGPGATSLPGDRHLQEPYVTWSAANPGVLSSRAVNNSMIAAHPASDYGTLDLRRLAVSYDGELHPITDVRLVTSTLGGSRSVPSKVYFSHVTSVG